MLGKRFFDNWSLGISGGPNIFFGDLKVDRYIPVSHNMNEWRVAGSVYLIRQFSHVISLRGQLLFGQIAGTRRVYSDGSPANQYFNGTLAEPNLNLMVNFMNIFGYNPGRKFFIYGTVGVGMTFWHTKKYDLITHAEIGEAGKAFPNWTREASIPAGLGAYYSIGDKVNLGVEWTLNGVNSDKLDATVGGFRYDMYSYLSLNLTINFNKRNPGTLKSANAGKNMGPVPPRPDLPAAPKAAAKPEQKDLYQQRPAPQTPRKDSMLFANREVKKQEVKKEEPAEQTIEDLITTPEKTEDVNSGPATPGLSYRVQVFAFRTDEYTAEAIRTRFHIKQTVYKEYTEGWHRFTVGTFKTLKAAQLFMVQMKSKNGVKDAFVARYKNGERVPTHPKP